jgi:hypothetical protein
MTLMHMSFRNLDTEGVRLNENNELGMGMGCLKYPCCQAGHQRERRWHLREDLSLFSSVK